MIWVLRFCLGLVVLGYAAWLALPIGQAGMDGATVTQMWSLLAPTDTPDALAAAGPMAAIVVFYIGAGLATATGLTWAPGLFFLGLVGEIGLRLAVASGMTRPTPAVLDIAGRTDAAMRPFGILVETTPLTLAALLAVGLCILVTGVWRGQKGAALTRIWSQPPVWA